MLGIAILGGHGNRHDTQQKYRACLDMIMGKQTPQVW